ncbi:MoaD/ThiS family protein [Pyrococcus yayanosii]|uniref:Molybdopterin converting factor related protein, subunit 1 n=1 Tax=Pyrococcus yayanosii (strain CH1 / JCM 16557) TaxID=529709 RepID=F8AEB7_PYRYC|nr:MoaD/ThiS family protein [Pyrococcus yayanosii]AEH24629.1 molybdopterin converting factor related protein, subunit 1 [Pyrococcus yayanosii CH1]
MPKVTVKLFATLIEITGKKSLELEARTIGELLEKLYAKFGEPFRRELESGFMILVNGHNIEHLKGLNTELKEGDKVSIFPPAGGG